MILALIVVANREIEDANQMDQQVRSLVFSLDLRSSLLELVDEEVDLRLRLYRSRCGRQMG